MVRNEQIASLERIRATRDDAAVTAALNALTHAAQHNENLLAAAVNAARVRATLGEISDALEVAFDRYLVPSQCVTGVIAQSYHQSEKSAPSSMPLLRKRSSSLPTMVVARAF